MEIVVLDGHTLNPGDISWMPLKDLGHLTVYDRTRPEEVLKRAQRADCILTNKTVLTADMISQLDKLRYIGVLATGYNVVDVEAAHGRGVAVTNIPAYSTQSVAQMVFAHLLNITNRVGHYAAANTQGYWCTSPDFCYWDTPLVELAGKRMGIVGLGHTGTATARLAQAFGMEVCASTSKHKKEMPEGIQKMELDELFRTCDVVSLHCPLTDDTREMVNAARLGTMKSTAVLINTGRGPLVNEQDVADALNTRRLAAYCADVLTVEPARADNPLLKASNAFITPHIAWATREARERLVQICAENIVAFLKGKPKNLI